MSKYVLTIIHGSKEYSNRYKDFMDFLQNQNIESFTGDLADHGKNLRKNFHNFTFKEMLYSALKIIDETKLKFPDHKHIIFGHSMGSFIVKYIVYNNIRDFDGVILSGTNHLSKTLISLALLATKSFNKNKVSRINQYLSYGWLSFSSKLNGYGSSWLSYNEENQKSFANDPLCGKNFSNKSLNAMFLFIKLSGEKEVLQNFKHKDIPQLLIYGEHDPITNYGADIKKLVKAHNKVGINNHKVISYEKCKHEILFDNLKEDVSKDIVSFIKNIK